MHFADRYQAGRRLAAAVSEYAAADTIVLGIPRGGIVVAYEVAAALEVPLEVLVVRKVGVPPLSSYAIGAVGEDGALVISEEAAERMGADAEQIDRVVARERRRVADKIVDYRQGGARRSWRDHTALVVDDGVATGRTALAAAQIVSAGAPRRSVLCTPVGPPRVIAELRRVYDDVVCLVEPAHMESIGTCYRNYRDTGELEVRTLLAAAASEGDR